MYHPLWSSSISTSSSVLSPNPTESRTSGLNFIYLWLALSWMFESRLGWNVFRIGDSDGKLLELEYRMDGSDLKTERPGQDELYMRIKEKARSFQNYPNICTHWWNPTFRSRGLGPSPRGQVCRRCTSRRQHAKDRYSSTALVEQEYHLNQSVVSLNDFLKEAESQMIFISLFAKPYWS